jgi:peptide/nickel transport system substrate-binding protein
MLLLAAEHDVDADPQEASDRTSLELFKCCLLRTLYTTNGLAVGQGGADLQPDLASGPPTISDDGLTWTIEMTHGLHYAPPFAATEITSPDIVRALEREAQVGADAGAGGYSSYYSPIVGFSDAVSGRARTISGLSTPGDHTLVIQLTQPTGDLGWRLAMPAAAPIPPYGTDPLGAAAGHATDYGRFLVASGPYMFDGSAKLDFSKPSVRQTPVSGFVPGRSMTLVRNPSWHSSTDSLRPAYASGMHVAIGGRTSALYAKVRSGDLDLVLDSAPTSGILEGYTTDPALQTRLFVDPLNAVDFISMNVAAPPFDDVHVRRALNWIVDKAGAVQLAGGPAAAVPTGHVFPDGVLDNALQTYDRFATPGETGDLEKAKAEMAQSKYAGSDGLCDAPDCKNVLAFTTTADPAPKVADLWKEGFARLGITLDVRASRDVSSRSRCGVPSDRVPLCLSVGWSQGYPDAYTFGVPLFSSTSLYPFCCNYGGLGASQAQLLRWGYAVSSVPDMDDRLAKCAAIVAGADRDGCWADLDRYLMEQVVPWVPVMNPNEATIVSSHVTNFSFDQLGQMAALDHLATDRTG